MEICHTGTIKFYKEFPELHKNNSKIIIREAVICTATSEDTRWIQNCNKEVIIWFDDYIPKNDILPIIAEFRVRKIICPVQTCDDIDEMEKAFGDSNTQLIVTLTASNEREYLATLGKALRSNIIKGIAFDYIHMLKPFKSFSIPPFAVRPRVLQHANVLYGLPLYNKEFFCLKMCGALSEILLLSGFGFISTLITDVAISTARSHVKLDDDAIIPTDFDLTFVKNHHIDDPNIDYKISEDMYKIIENNIKVMEEHN